MSPVKLVCFDLDDTLMRRVHSVMLLCILSGKLEQMRAIEALGLDFEHEDRLKIKTCCAGARESDVHERFEELTFPLGNVAQTIDILRARGIRTILIGCGPQQVVQRAAELWHIEECRGSIYETRNGVFTGEILEHINAERKVELLDEYAVSIGLALDDCMAIGDGFSDMKLFESCGHSLAINATQEARKVAQHTLDTDNLLDILKYIN